MAIRGVTVGGQNYQFDYRYLANKPSVGEVSLSASWTGSDPATQVVSVTGATAGTKVDLQPDETVIGRMAADGTTALWVDNDDGTLVAKAMGNPPTQTLVVQCTLTEM